MNALLARLTEADRQRIRADPSLARECAAALRRDGSLTAVRAARVIEDMLLEIGGAQ